MQFCGDAALAPLLLADAVSGRAWCRASWARRGARRGSHPSCTPLTCPCGCVLVSQERRLQAQRCRRRVSLLLSLRALLSFFLPASFSPQRSSLGHSSNKQSAADGISFPHLDPPRPCHSVSLSLSPLDRRLHVPLYIPNPRSCYPTLPFFRPPQPLESGAPVRRPYSDNCLQCMIACVFIVADNLHLVGTSASPFWVHPSMCRENRRIHADVERFSAETPTPLAGFLVVLAHCPAAAVCLSVCLPRNRVGAWGAIYLAQRVRAGPLRPPGQPPHPK